MHLFHLLISIIWLTESVWVWPIVILLSGVYYVTFEPIVYIYKMTDKCRSVNQQYWKKSGRSQLKTIFLLGIITTAGAGNLKVDLTQNNFAGKFYRYFQ